MPQDTPTPIVYSAGLTLDQIINMPVAPMLCTPAEGERTWFVNSFVNCQDGTTLSVQASEGHYCQPRSNEGPYTAVEVGYPTADPGAEWLEHKDNPSSGDFKDVYAYVPVEKVRAFIAAHGGEVLSA